MLNGFGEVLKSAKNLVAQCIFPWKTNVTSSPLLKPSKICSNSAASTVPPFTCVSPLDYRLLVLYIELDVCANPVSS